MKCLIVLLIITATSVNVTARQETVEALVQVLEEAVASAAKGDLPSAVRSISNESKKPIDIKMVNARVEEFREMYKKLAGLGQLDETERLSLIFTGESFSG